MGEFEKDIREMFVDLEVPIDTNELWKGIERKLDKKNKKYPVWWLLVPLLIIPIIIYSLNTQLSNTKNTDSEIATTNVPAVKEKTKKIKDKSLITELVKNTESNNLKKTKSGNVSIRNNRNNSRDIVSKSNLFVSKETLDIYKNADIIKDNRVRDEKHMSILEGKERYINAKKERSEERLSYNMLRLRNSINLLSSDNIFELKLVDFDPKITKTRVKSPARPWEKSLDIGIGFALVNKSLRATDKSYIEYKTIRETTESYLEAINANLAFNLKNKSGLFISSGINYTQIDERFTSKDSLNLYSQKEGVTKEITNSDGSLTVERSLKEVAKQLNWDKVIYNYYHFIDIPLSIGYSMNISNWKLQLSSGLSYNIVFAKRGQIIGFDNYPVNINDEAIFKTNTGLNFISNIKVIFDYKNHSFYFEPNIKYNINSIGADKNPLEQKYFSYGIKLGSRFKF